MELVSFFEKYAGDAIILFLGGLVKWIWDKYNPKEKAEVASSEIDNGVKVVELYKNALDDLGSRYEKKYAHLEEMSKNISDLFEKKEQILMKEIEYHTKQTALYKKMYDDKVREFNKYKKEHP